MTRWAAPALYSLKTAIAALTALGIGLTVDLPMPFWAMTTVYITSNPISGATRSKAIYRALGTTLGAAFAVAVVPALVEWPALLSLALAAWVGGCLFLSLLDRSPRSYVLMLAGYTAAIIAFPSVNRPETIFDIASARMTEIMLGITCATVFHSLFWPMSVAERLGPRLSTWLADAETWLRDAMHGTPQAEEDRRRLAVDALDCVLLSTHVPYDTSHWRESTRTVQALLYRMLLLLPLISGLADRRTALAATAQDEADAARMDEAAKATDRWLAAGYPSSPPDTVPARIPFDWAGLLRESFLIRLTQTCRVLSEAHQLNARLQDPHALLPPGLADEWIPLKLHTDPGFAALSGISAMIAMLLVCTFWILTGWPDGASGAMMVGVFCCLFAAMDNPVPAIISFSIATLAAMPVAAVYLFAILPRADDFVPLCIVLLPTLLIAGMFLSNPRKAMPATAFMMCISSSLAIQEDFSADFAHFANSNLSQIVAMVVAATTTATLRTIGTDAAIARLVRKLRGDLATLAAARNPPDPAATLARATDQLALITQRLGEGDATAGTGLAEVRVAMNIATLQQLRTDAGRSLKVALTRLLRALAEHFTSPDSHSEPPFALLERLDNALRLTLKAPPSTRETMSADPSFGGPAPATALIGGDPAVARAALVALRRNLFPSAPAFSPE